MDYKDTVNLLHTPFSMRADLLNRQEEMLRRDGERAILDSMSKRETLASLGEVEHEYPPCWRCASPLITRATEQWFVKVDHCDPPRRQDVARL